mgnify:CR=1 FL=1|tara:strand:- start:865 stop:1692 length:828 start_codon:yes stop_codon:yes gene_type:complete
MKVGFIGLGTMGFQIAKNLSKNQKINIFTRNKDKIIKFNKSYNSQIFNNYKDLVIDSDLIFTCLPTSNEVNEICENLKLSKKKKYFIDLTSGDYNLTVEISDKLLKKNIIMLDAPISGGPEKAEKGTLTSMIGGNEEDYLYLEKYFKQYSIPNYVGKIGSAHAIKSVNNLLNVTNLIIANEGIKSLEEKGIDANTALNVINQSSGRSLMTQERIPKHVIEKNHYYGFKLNLMKKDVKLALNLIRDKKYFESILEKINNTLDKYEDNCDYTYVCKD